MGGSSTNIRCSRVAPLAGLKEDRGGDANDDDDGVDSDGDDGDDYGDDCWNDEDDDGGSWDADREIEQRSKNFGFSDDEVNGYVKV